MSRNPWIALVVASCAWAPLPAAAQDGSSGSAVAMFARCLPYAGHPDGLRAFAERRRLPRVPAGDAAFITDRPAAVFDASTAGRHMALVSEDGGAFRVVMQSGDFASVRAALLARAKDLGVGATVLSERTAHGADRTVYRLSGHGRRWTVSVSGVTAPAPPTSPEEVDLLASPG